jgi:foldase protein PrsA
MRSIGVLLAPLALATPFAAGCGHDSPSVPTWAIAVVGDRTISRAQYETLMSQAKQSYSRRGRSFPGAGTSAYERLKQSAVRLLVERAELEQKAPGLGVTIDPGEVAARRELLIEDSFGGSEQRYRARLRKEGMTDAQVRSALHAQLLFAAVFEAVTADVTVSTAAAQGYYESHLATYSAPRHRTIRHILVATRAAARRIVKRLRAGGSFAALARLYSRDARTRDRGGRLELVEGRTAPALDSAAFALPVDGLSEPFATGSGWDIVQAVSPVRAGRMTPFADVRDSILRLLLAQKRRQTFGRWLAGVQAEFAARTVYAEGFSPRDGG